MGITGGNQNRFDTDATVIKYGNYIMTNPQALVELIDVSVRSNGMTILNSVNLSIYPGEQWAIVGHSGSGKTSLAQAMAGKIFHSGSINYRQPPSSVHTHTVLMVEQQHLFRNLSNTRDFYYQQRFNSSDAGNSITVEQALSQYGTEQTTESTREKWIELLHLTPLMQEPLIQLSNGENKRLQLAEALLASPGFLILDNPFTGLDADGRKTLHSIIENIGRSGIPVLLITSPQELPDYITHVAVLENGALSTFTKSDYARSMQNTTVKTRALPHLDQLIQLEAAAGAPFDFAIRMLNVNVHYGEKTILENIHWEVRRGDCWHVSGPNGAGKSTLLSLVTADNPQAYANEIYLFDKRRGKGESIWDIKKWIGYISPELHLFFEQHSSGFEVIASGLFDTIGLFRQLSTAQVNQVESWIALLQLQSIRQKSLSQLSLGQQRMLLLARALVKNPPLLILDEPCQGLDTEQTEYFKQLVDRLCRHFKTTLVYVSHYEKDIPSCVNQFLRLEHGRRLR